MYRHFIKIATITIFALMLLFPKQVFDGASKGLLLWFNSVLPTLLPFIILSNLLIKTHSADWLARITGPLLKPIFRVSGQGSLAIVTGFLCGYPMGSKVIADLLLEERISFCEAQYLLSFCNNASPIFIISYLVLQNLGQENLAAPILAILLLSPILISFLTRRFYKMRTKGRYPAKAPTQGSIKSPAKDNTQKESLIDSCIMNGFEVITKVGGYIILFSIFLSLAEMLPAHGFLFQYFLLPSLEITGGISLLCKSSLTAPQTILLCVFCTSFGGWCAAAQAKCMIAGTGLSIKSYIIQKLAVALTASILCYIYLRFLY